jgi:hypothetical protein
MGHKIFKAAQFIAPMLLFAACALAQNDPFNRTAQGVATSAIALARWIGIIAMIGFGFSIMASHDRGIMGRMGGVFAGLIFALFANPIVTWVQGL